MTLTTIFHRAPVIETIDGQDIQVGEISSNPDELLYTFDPKDEPTFEAYDEPRIVPTANWDVDLEEVDNEDNVTVNLEKNGEQEAPFTNRGAQRELGWEQDKQDMGQDRQELWGKQDEMPFACHWFHGTTNVALEDVLETLPFVLGLSDLNWTEMPNGGFTGYSVSYELVRGIKVCCDPSRLEQKVLILIKGDGCELLGDDVLAKVFDEYFGEDENTGENKGEVTRFDVAIDNCPFTPQQLYEEWRKDNVRTRCKAPDPKKVRVRKGMEGVRTHGWHSNNFGDTLEMGSRASTQYARCYDMRGFTRFELETHKGRAHELARCYLRCDGTRGEIAMGAIRDFVDFVDANGATRRVDCALLSFWHDFVQSVERLATLVSEVVERTVAKTKEWIENTVSATLYTYVSLIEGMEYEDAFGVFKRLMRIGYGRLKSKHKILLQTVGQEPMALSFSPSGGF